MKTCTHCGATKGADEFDKRNGKPVARCKDCRRAYIRGWLSRQPDGFRTEYRREWAKRPDVMVRERERNRRQYKKNPAARIAATKKWMAKHPEIVRERAYEWRRANPLKKKAQDAVKSAIRGGRLTKMPCSVCGSATRPNAHHPDHSKPLDVIWLCPVHHRAEHMKGNG